MAIPYALTVGLFKKAQTGKTSDQLIYKIKKKKHSPGNLHGLLAFQSIVGKILLTQHKLTEEVDH